MTMDAVAVSEGWVIVALFLVLCLSAAKFYGTQKAPRRWPLLGFLPSLIYNFNDFYEWSTHILILNRGTVPHAKGAWTNWVVTADPTNVEYIMKIKFHNFVKGNELRKVFGDVFGVMAIFLQDGETWRQLRTTASTLFASMSTRNDVIQTTSMLVHQRLIPLFQHAATEGTVLDLEDIFHRYGFDSVCNFGLGFDPGSLALDLPLNHFAETYDRSIKLSVRRLFVPSVCWKTLRFLNLGTERQMRKDRRVIDDYIGEICAMQRQEMAQNNADSVCPGFLPLILRLGKEKHGRIYSDDELRDTCLSIIMAGRDTTGPALTWFFWLLQQHPGVEDNILMELKDIIRRRRDENDAEPDPFTLDELREMNYLQAALSESLRLYPSVPIEILEVVNDDAAGWKQNKEGVDCNVPILLHGPNGEHLGRRLLRFQPRSMAPKWQIREQVGVHIPRLQPRPSPVPRKGRRQSANEVGVSVYYPALLCQTAARTSCGAKVWADVAYEVRLQGQILHALNNQNKLLTRPL